MQTFAIVNNPVNNIELQNGSIVEILFRTYNFDDFILFDRNNIVEVLYKNVIFQIRKINLINFWVV
jgi:hypothetical protein